MVTGGQNFPPHLTKQDNLADGCAVYRFSEVDSTNTVAKIIAENETASSFWVVSDIQTAGKGSRGRDWVSPVGNFYGSFATKTAVEPRFAATLAFVASLALRNTLAEFVDPAIITLKWPNDILFKGAKISGILLEYQQISRNNGSGLAIIGFGINCISYPKIANYQATCLFDNGVEITPNQLLVRLHIEFMNLFHMWDGGDGFSTIRDEWLRYAANIGKKITVKLPDITINGIFDDIDQFGALDLDIGAGKRQKISVGDIFLN